MRRRSRFFVYPREFYPRILVDSGKKRRYNELRFGSPRFLPPENGRLGESANKNLPKRKSTAIATVCATRKGSYAIEMLQKVTHGCGITTSKRGLGEFIPEKLLRRKGKNGWCCATPESRKGIETTVLRYRMISHSALRNAGIPKGN
jgi:hypothetical protein